MSDLEQQIQALEVRADDYVKALERHYLECDRIPIEFDDYFFSRYGIKPMWYDGAIRRDIFVVRLENVAWLMKWRHESEQTKKNYRAPRKKVIRELDALGKALDGLSPSAWRVITKSAISLDEEVMKSFRDHDPIKMLQLLLENLNYEGEYPASGIVRRMWIEKTKEVFDDFHVFTTGDAFDKTLELISKAAGIDPGAHGVKNAIKDILTY